MTSSDKNSHHPTDILGIKFQEWIQARRQNISCFKLSVKSVKSLSRVWLFATPWTVSNYTLPIKKNICIYMCIYIQYICRHTHTHTHVYMASLMAHWVKNLPAVQETRETRVQPLGWEDPLEEEIATHSSILAGKIPWTEEPSRLQSKESGATKHTCLLWQRKQSCGWFQKPLYRKKGPAWCQELELVLRCQPLIHSPTHSGLCSPSLLPCVWH